MGIDLKYHQGVNERSQDVGNARMDMAKERIRQGINFWIVMDIIERELLTWALHEGKGASSAAAEFLGISRTTFKEKVNRLLIDQAGIQALYKRPVPGRKSKIRGPEPATQREDLGVHVEEAPVPEIFEHFYLDD